MGALSRVTDGPFKNMLHSERLGSFLEGGWPDIAQASSFTSLCTPQKLAQAGLEYYAKGQARCVICSAIVKDLKPTCNPWIRHSDVSPDCLLVKYGMRNRPDDYTVKEFVQLLAERRVQQINAEFGIIKSNVVKILGTAYKAERNNNREGSF